MRRERAKRKSSKVCFSWREKQEEEEESDCLKLLLITTTTFFSVGGGGGLSRGDKVLWLKKNNINEEGQT